MIRIYKYISNILKYLSVILGMNLTEVFPLAVFHYIHYWQIKEQAVTFKNGGMKKIVVFFL